MTDASVQYCRSSFTTLLEENEGALFIAHTNRFREKVAALRKAFSKHYKNINLGFSYKTNHLPDLCRIAHQMGMYAELVFGSEYAIAQELSVPGSRMLFNGPTKFDAELRTAFTHGTPINIDRANEASQLSRLEKEFFESIRVDLRCNLDLAGKTSSPGLVSAKRAVNCSALWRFWRQ